MSESLAIVMAAGKGTRMESDLPKVLLPVCGRPMIEYVLDTLDSAGISKSVVVVGYRADEVRETLRHRSNISFVDQTEQQGTGHAVMMCRDELNAHEGAVLVVTGDSPMLQVDSVNALLDLYRNERPACILGTLNSGDPQGLGRILRNDQGDFVGIVEDKDANSRPATNQRSEHEHLCVRCSTTSVRAGQTDQRQPAGRILCHGLSGHPPG